MSLKYFAKVIFKINIFKTLLLNFHYFPFIAAMRLPVFVYWRTALKKMKGEIVIPVPVKTGMFHLGARCLESQDAFYSRTIWNVEGKLIVNGVATIGRGSKITIAKGASLSLGDAFKNTGNSEIVCHNSIIFGVDCLLSWDTLLMDSDFHSILDASGRVINSSKPIIIGNHVWIGCRSIVLKGSAISDNCIVAAGSVVTREYNERNSVIVGSGKDGIVIKRGVDWRL